MNRDYIIYFAEYKYIFVMKFTKQQAYENIVAQLTPNGETLSLSERSINEQLETLIPLLANEETELEDFVKNCLPIFKTANANVNNDVSSGINKYKEEHPVRKPPVVVPKNEGNSDLEQKLAEMERRMNEMESQKKISSIKDNIKKILNEKGVKDGSWIDSMLSEVHIADDCDIEKKSQSILKLYNKTIASVDPSNTPGGAGGGDDMAAIDKVIKEAGELAKQSRLI